MAHRLVTAYRSPCMGNSQLKPTKPTAFRIAVVVAVVRLCPSPPPSGRPSACTHASPWPLKDTPPLAARSRPPRGAGRSRHLARDGPQLLVLPEDCLQLPLPPVQGIPVGCLHGCQLRLVLQLHSPEARLHLLLLDLAPLPQVRRLLHEVATSDGEWNRNSCPCLLLTAQGQAEAAGDLPQLVLEPLARQLGLPVLLLALLSSPAELGLALGQLCLQALKILFHGLHTLLLLRNILPCLHHVCPVLLLRAYLFLLKQGHLCPALLAQLPQAHLLCPTPLLRLRLARVRTVTLRGQLLLQLPYLRVNLATLPLELALEAGLCVHRPLSVQLQVPLCALQSVRGLR
mmetsp:Transcript_126053/g.368355  ORF Transcript_126053/g.368355 Transcript_126053/m.368355 type:complete len:344 (-) Transcript_126053:1549-2580(-)